MFVNLNGGIGLGFALIFLAPFWGFDQLFLYGCMLLGLVFLARYYRFVTRFAALGAAALSAYVILILFPQITALDTLDESVQILVDLAQHGDGQRLLLLLFLASLSFVNAVMTVIWGQSRQTAKSFEKLGI